MERFIWTIVLGLKRSQIAICMLLRFTRITFPYIHSSLLQHLLGVLNSMDKFAAYCNNMNYNNFVVIAVFVFMQDSPWLVMQLLGDLCFLGWCTIFLVALGYLRHTGIKLWFRRPKVTDSMRKMWKLLFPGVIGSELFS